MRIRTADEDVLAIALVHAQNEQFPSLDKRKFVKEHPDVLERNLWLEFTIGLQNQIELGRRHLSKTLVVKSDPQDPFATNPALQQVINRQLHPR